MLPRNLTDPHHVTVGFVGRPGSRTFYFQVQQDADTLTLRLEKGQVAGIAELLGQLLARIDDTPATDWDRPAMALREPVEALAAVGDVAVGLDPDEERFLIELECRSADADDRDDEGATVRVLMQRDQARRLAAHAAEQVAQGRPTCQLCSRPLEADGRHVCPATNGHGELTR